jgi:hypothetical protein
MSKVDQKLAFESEEQLKFRLSVAGGFKLVPPCLQF